MNKSLYLPTKHISFVVLTLFWLVRTIHIENSVYNYHLVIYKSKNHHHHHLQGSHLAVPAFITAICCTTAFVLLPPRSIQFSPNCCSCFSTNSSILPDKGGVDQREYNDISDADNYVQGNS